MSSNATILYIPHGGGPLPLMNDPGHVALNRFLGELPATFTRPDAIIVISAHWEEPVIAITASRSPELLYDYHGFPVETYQYQYPVAGHPELAERVQQLLAHAGIEARLDYRRGFDHGLFVPLILMYPEADIPCIQISLAASLDAATHVQLGQALAELKSENILILGSGSSFHNMKALMRRPDDSIDQCNQEFETWLAETCSDPGLSENEREVRIINWEMAPQARYCHPREEHLLPLQVCYGVGRSAARTVFQEKIAGFLSSAYQW